MYNHIYTSQCIDYKSAWVSNYTSNSSNDIRHFGYIMLIRARPFIDAGIDFSNDTISHHSGMLCTQAASSCIQTGQLIHSHVPPSHYLAFCTHELAISGILLLVLLTLLIRLVAYFAKLDLSDNKFHLIGCARVPIALCPKMWFPKSNCAFSSSHCWRPYGLGPYEVE